VLSYLMYPQVFVDYSRKLNLYDNVSVIPTPAFWYGLQSGEEISVEIEPGKVLIIRYLTAGDPREDGTRTVFFELNGQPRRAKVPDRSRAATSKARRKAEPGNDAHLGAPMPGVVSTIAVAAGQPVKAGDVLLSIEAMKMETAIHAEADGVVAEVTVKPGDQIEPAPWVVDDLAEALKMPD